MIPRTLGDGHAFCFLLPHLVSNMAMDFVCWTKPAAEEGCERDPDRSNSLNKSIIIFNLINAKLAPGGQCWWMLASKHLLAMCIHPWIPSRCTLCLFPLHQNTIQQPSQDSLHKSMSPIMAGARKIALYSPWLHVLTVLAFGTKGGNPFLTE